MDFFLTCRPILNAIKQPVVVLDELNIVFVNYVAKQLFGNNAENLPRELIEEAKGNKNPKVVTQAYESGRGWYDLTYIPMESNTALVFENTTDFTQIDEELYRMSISISRQIKLPLTMLFSASSLLTDKLSMQADMRVKKYLSVIDQNSYRILRSINNISDYVNFIRGSVNFNPQTHDLAAFCRETVKSVDPIAQDMGITLSFDAFPEQIMACFDSDKVERLLYNLLSNAFKYTKKGGQVSVRINAIDKRAFITVTDTGEGIPSSILPFAFHRYAMRDADNFMTTGFGLGLGIVKSIAVLHGGSVALESREGEGTKVTFMLPLENGEQQYLRESVENVDYAGGFSHLLLEFSDMLPSEKYFRKSDKR